MALQASQNNNKFCEKCGSKKILNDNTEYFCETCYNYIPDISWFDDAVKSETSILPPIPPKVQLPLNLRTFKFGKHKGKTYDDVFKTDKKYLQWILTQEWFNQAS